MSTKAMNYLVVVSVLVLLFTSFHQTYMNWLQYSHYWHEDTCPLHCTFCPLYPDKSN